MVFSSFLVNFCVFLTHDSGHLQIQFIDTPEIQIFEAGGKTNFYSPGASVNFFCMLAYLSLPFCCLDIYVDILYVAYLKSKQTGELKIY